MASLGAFAILPGRVLAQVCTTERPGWDGTPVNALGEALTLFATPASLLVLALTVVAVRFRSQWMGLVAVLGWTGVVSLVTLTNPTGNRVAAMAEGCIGRPTLFIAVVAAICVATVIYTMPRKADG